MNFSVRLEISSSCHVYIVLRLHFMLMNDHFSIQILSEPSSEVFLCYAWRILPASQAGQNTKSFYVNFIY